MEGNAMESFKEELRKFSKATEELLLSDSKCSLMGTLEDEFAETEKCSDLLRERENLNSRLEELKKENFFLRASLKAWLLTLKNKLEELDEADLMLKKIYNEIWSEREKFCSKAEEFIEECGIVSEWWQRQTELGSNLEGQENKGQVEVGETEEHGKQGTEVKQGSEEFREDGDRDEEWEKRVSPKGSKGMKEEESKGRVTKPTENELFSIVDLEKVRKANRLKKRRQRQHNKH